MANLSLMFMFFFAFFTLTSARHSGGCGGNAPENNKKTGVEAIINANMFNVMFRHRNPFYTYDAFVTAAIDFPEFCSTGTTEVRKQELAAFLAHTSKVTAGGEVSTPDASANGYVLVEANDKGQYCKKSTEYPCARGKCYHGRGPLQITWNYNYGAAGKGCGFDGINNPETVSKDPVISFKTAIWYWMNSHEMGKPSCHDVMVGAWVPSLVDYAAGRVSTSFGTLTNLLNGASECGKGPNEHVKARIGFYQRYCQLLGINAGGNLDCYKQKPWIQTGG